MTKLKLHPEARKELDGVRRYYRERDAEVARRFARSVLDVYVSRIVERAEASIRSGLAAATRTHGVRAQHLSAIGWAESLALRERGAISRTL